MYTIVDVNPENVEIESLFCIKDKSSNGYKQKLGWFIERHNEGLKLKILKNSEGKAAGFIEYIPGKYAWRPVKADNYLFIHCIMVYSKSDRDKGYATTLLNECENDAHELGYKGIAASTSKGSWISDKNVFLKNGFSVIDKKDRFELLVKKFDSGSESPSFVNWTKNQKLYKLGWHLIYADQCPWHDKSANDLRETAKSHGIDLNIKKIQNSDEIGESPSGYGAFNIVYNGKLVADNYISKTRFINIVKKELKIK